ncbi:hypothetical protein ACGF12_18435 [Kitasatospora sp. NPDC048296]|uniref:hypothetical protein n=1 Tax=Kitasatospora sp. NPDC048296 TaxID=3364048 RepID=UPI00371E3DB2
MRVHRTEHVRHFTVLPNSVLQYRKLSYTARGLLADLLSRPDDWREDGRHMADTSPQGRGAIRKALKELADAGFYRVETIRLPDGTVRTENHVYDTPWVRTPAATHPAPGEPTTGCADLPVVKKPDQETTLPPLPATAANPCPDQQPTAPDEQLKEAVATLFRVIRPEPRLRLGQSEAEELAPLVAQWLQRGSTPADLAQALLHGLPTPMHSAAAVLGYRLHHKMPPPRTPGRPPTARYTECKECRDPVPRPGTCRACAGLVKRSATGGCAASVAIRGASRARTALSAARPAGGGPSRSWCEVSR